MPYYALGAQKPPSPLTFYFWYFLVLMLILGLGQDCPAGLNPHRGQKKVRLKLITMYNYEGWSLMQDALQGQVRAPQGQRSPQGLELEEEKKHHPLFSKKIHIRGVGYMCSKCKTRVCPIDSSSSLLLSVIADFICLLLLHCMNTN